MIAKWARSLLLASGLASLGLLTTPTLASSVTLTDVGVVRDQGQIFGTGGNVVLGTEFFSQSITSGVTGELVAIEVQYENFGSVEPIEYSIFSGGNPVNGSVIYSELVSSPQTDVDGVFRWLLPASNTLFFAAGEQFTFAFQAQIAGVIFAASDPPDYLGGELFENGAQSTQAGDVAFITFVAPVAPVPVPPSMALLGGAIAFLSIGSSLGRWRYWSK
jgi:hypothetical protein